MTSLFALMMAVMMMVMIGDDDALWLEDEEGSNEVEDESIFALDLDSVAVVQLKVEGEASFLEKILYYQCNKILPPPPVPPP